MKLRLTVTITAPLIKLPRQLNRACPATSVGSDRCAESIYSSVILSIALTSNGIILRTSSLAA